MALLPFQLIGAYSRIGRDLFTALPVRRLVAAQAALALAVGVLALIALGVSGLALFGVRIVEAGDRVDVEFYRQAAQIIPVLLLGVALERRAFELRRVAVGEYAARAARVILAFALLLCVVVGEAVSLYAVAFRASYAGFFPITIVAIGGLGLMLVSLALGLGDSSGSDSRDSTSTHEIDA